MLVSGNTSAVGDLTEAEKDLAKKMGLPVAFAGNIRATMLHQ